MPNQADRDEMQLTDTKSPNRDDSEGTADSSGGGTVTARIGLVGQIGRFRTNITGLQRGQRVVCRTSRGLEVGIVLRYATAVLSTDKTTDGRIIRTMTAEDELLWGHLRQLGELAFRRCVSQLSKLGSSAVLLEVEPLLDGKTLYFHFLSAVDTNVQEQLDQLVNIYERQVRRSKFARLVEHGCGPGCGTGEAKKRACGGSCAVCKIAGACGS
jgi:hypothetical protein